MKGWNLMKNGKDNRADSGEGEEEADPGHEYPPTRPIRNALVNNRTERRALEQQ
jgi:hypothetical protein